MNGKHFEIGTIQAFLDGETTPDVSLRLTDHVASCDACAKLLATAEEESSFVFSALERELNSLVPTQRLWSRINESIEVEQNNTSAWEKFLAYIRASLVNPSIAAAAGIILVAGMFAILWMPKGGPAVVQNPPIEVPPSVGSTSQAAPPINATPGPVEVATNNDSNDTPTYTTVTNHSPDKIARMVKADHRPLVEAPVVLPAGAYLPGEETYVKTIADMKPNVDSQKDTVLSASSRVSYERDMAVVEDSIKRMREVVRKNPRNQAARQVLYSSYQDKIDLMNSVSQREEIMASLK